MRQSFLKLYRLGDRVLHVAAWIAGIFTFAIMLLVVANAFSRKLFNEPVPAAVEITQALLVAAIMLPFAFTLLKREHVNTVFLTSKLPDQTQRWMYFFWMVVGFLLFLGVTYGTFAYAMRSYRMNEQIWGATIQFPMWPAKLAVTFGTALICLQFLIEALGTLLIRDFHQIKTGQAEAQAHV